MAAVLDLGLMPYESCAELQRELLEGVALGTKPNTLIFVEHPSVYTLGANFHESNLLLSREEYTKRGIEIHTTERGGDITFHSPGQLVIYPIFNIEEFGKDLHKWLRDLEEAMIVALDSVGLSANRFAPNTGVWIGSKKVAAIGIKVRKWVSMHGIALNCCNDLEPFDWIIPCGIHGYGVTSISNELCRNVSTAELKPKVLKAFTDTFCLEFD